MVRDRNLLIRPLVLHKHQCERFAGTRSSWSAAVLTQFEKDSPSSMGSSMIWCPLTCSQINKVLMKRRQRQTTSPGVVLVASHRTGRRAQPLHAHMYDGRVWKKKKKRWVTSKKLHFHSSYSSSVCCQTLYFHIDQLSTCTSPHNQCSKHKKDV